MKWSLNLNYAYWMVSNVVTVALESNSANLKFRSVQNLLSREQGIRWFLVVLSSRGKILGNFEGPLSGETLICQSWWRHPNSKFWYFANFYPTGQGSQDNQLRHLFHGKGTAGDGLEIPDEDKLLVWKYRLVKIRNSWSAEMEISKFNFDNLRKI